jgi:hypothetical protein
MTRIREFLNKNPLAIGVLLALSIGLVAWRLAAGRKSSAPLPVIPDRCFYTTDDGTTLFPDSLTRIPPFDYNGKPAVRACVFTCDGSRHQWVGYLEKYSDSSIGTRGASDANSPTTRLPPQSALMVKTPGTDAWQSESSPAGAAIMNVKCPDGMDGGAIRVVMPTSDR